MSRNRIYEVQDCHNEPLRTMVAVGAVAAHSVRLWMRAERPGVVTIHWWPEGEEQAVSQGDICIPVAHERDNTCRVRVPEDVPPAVPLIPLRSTAGVVRAVA